MTIPGGSQVRYLGGVQALSGAIIECEPARLGLDTLSAGISQMRLRFISHCASSSRAANIHTGPCERERMT